MWIIKAFNDSPHTLSDFSYVCIEALTHAFFNIDEVYLIEKPIGLLKNLGELLLGLITVVNGKL